MDRRFTFALFLVAGLAAPCTAQERSPITYDDYYRIESEFYGTPWEEEGLKNLLAASPIVHAQDVSTPTLFVLGESDHRVPIEEAEQMYVALQKQGVPARMVRYPESYHGGWTPWRYLHRLYSTLQWWDRWLGEKPLS